MRQCARGVQRRGQGSGWDVYPLLCVVHRSLAPAAGRRSGTAGFAGGYRLPFTALAMVLGVGGPEGAQLTSMDTVLVVALLGLVTARVANGLSLRVRGVWRGWVRGG
jgi:hypothetical protein